MIMITQWWFYSDSQSESVLRTLICIATGIDSPCSWSSKVCSYELTCVSTEVFHQSHRHAHLFTNWLTALYEFDKSWHAEHQSFTKLTTVCCDWHQTLTGWPQSPTHHWLKQQNTHKRMCVNDMTGKSVYGSKIIFYLGTISVNTCPKVLNTPLIVHVSFSIMHDSLEDRQFTVIKHDSELPVILFFFEKTKDQFNAFYISCFKSLHHHCCDMQCVASDVIWCCCLGSSWGRLRISHFHVAWSAVQQDVAGDCEGLPPPRQPAGLWWSSLLVSVV